MKYVSKVLLLFSLLCPAVLSLANQQEWPAMDGLEVAPNGSFTFDRLPVMVCHFDLGWNRVDQRRLKTAPGYPKSNAALSETQGTLQPRDIPEPITLRQRLDRIDAHSFRVRYEASHPAGAPTREIYLQIELPMTFAVGKTVLLDGKPHTLPVDFSATRLAVEDKIQRRTLVVPGASGTVTIEGVFSVLLQDARQWRQDVYALRLRFSPQKDPLTKAALELTFRHTPSPDAIAPLPPVMPWTAVTSTEWAEHAHALDIEAGSVFDFSSQLDAPAGKHGPVIVTPEGHFAFRDLPGERARFWGVNLCFSANFLEKDLADQLAERLARSGYNSVRFHHYDRELQKKDGASWELDPEKLDRFDYLFTAMKKRGLYINIDLYTSRTFTPEEFASVGFPPVTDTSAAAGEMHWRFKAILPVSEQAFDIWAQFARNLLTHRNPYTGLTWGQDPAVVGICPVNEDAPRNRIDSDPVVSRLYQERFAAWRALPENRTQTDKDRERAFNRFVYETQIEFNARLRAFLHDLGVTVPLTGTNHRTAQGLAFVRQHHDYVDNHRYWDHPSFPQERFRIPFQFRQASATRHAAEVPRDLMPTRITGKPFAMTEFNFVRPNSHRAEGGVLMPAYASLQDWDALYNFDYASHSRDVERPGLGGTFSISADPIGQIADRVGAAIFLRGDIAPARGLIGFAVQPGTAFVSRETPFPDVFSRLGLITRIGSQPAAPEALLREPGIGAVVVEPADYRPGVDQRIYPAENTLTARLERDGVLPRGSISDNGRRYRSETGQIELRTDAGTIKVVAPRSEQFVLPSGAALSGDRVAVRNGSVFGTVSVIAVDGQPLARSGRLLVTHLTDSLLTGMRFADATRRLLETRGQLPHLLRRGAADLTLKLGEGNYRAWAVSPSGARLHEVPLTPTNDGWHLHAETVTPQGTQLAYEIAREQAR